jgi:peptide/nickel transport system substrate-binding protein
VTADDVRFTFERFAERRHPRFTPQLRDLESVAALDSRTVAFRLRRPSLGFLEFPLADVPIIPRHLWEGLPEGRRARRAGRGQRAVPAGRASGEAAVPLETNRDWFEVPRVAEIRVPIIRTTRGRSKRCATARSTPCR